MKLTNQIFLCLAIGLTGAAAWAGSPLFQIGDDVDVFFDGTGTIKYQTNLFWDDDERFHVAVMPVVDAAGNPVLDSAGNPLSAPQYVDADGDGDIDLVSNDLEEDFIFVFSPGLEFRYGKPGGEGKVKFLAREEIWLYAGNSHLNTELAKLSATASYSDVKINFSSHAKWHQLYHNDAFTNPEGDIIKRDHTSMGANLEYNWTEKTTAGIGLIFFYEHFPRNVRVMQDGNGNITESRWTRDRYQVTMPLDFYYSFSPKLAVSGGYRYRWVDLTDDKRRDVQILDAAGNIVKYKISDSQDHFVNIGLRGELAPKLDSQLRVGYQVRDFEREYPENHNSLSLLSDFVWETTPKVTLKATVNRDYRTSGSGGSSVDFGGGLSALYSFSPRLSGLAALNYNNTQYHSGYDDEREDDTFTARLSVSYNVNEYVRMSAGYTYQNNDSDSGGQFNGSSYQNNMIHFTAALRY